ncbi:MAG: branched-chain amino acid ABC transporter permease [Spirochaetota bacterium]
MYYYLLLVLTHIAIYFILSISLNLVVGFTGQLSLGHAAFLAIGAYSVGVFTSFLYSFSFWWIWLASAVFAACIAFLMGLPILRLKGDYLAIGTLGLGEAVRAIIQNWDPVTRGPKGISGIRGPALGVGYLRDDMLLYALFAWALALLIYLFCRHLIRTRLGRGMEAVREDDIAASSVGINPMHYKLLAFSLSAAFAALAGGLWAARFGTITDGIGSFEYSVLFLSMVVLGGMGNLWGSLLGATVIAFLDFAPQMFGLTNFIPPESNRIFYGLLLVVMMLYRPQGFLGRSKPKFIYDHHLKQKV